MAVQARGRKTGSASPRIPADTPALWLNWLAGMLADYPWMALIEFSAESHLPLRKTTLPADRTASTAALALARKACVSKQLVLARMSNKTDRNKPSDKAARSMLLALPLPGSMPRVLLLQGAAASQQKQSATLKLCQWASAWLDRAHLLPVEPVAARGSNDHPLAQSLAQGILQAFHEHHTPAAVSLAIVNSARRLCGCLRVSLLTTDQRASPQSLKLQAISGQSRVDMRKVVPVQIVAAVNEQLQQAIPSGCYVASEEPDAELMPASATMFAEQGRCQTMLVCAPANAQGNSPYPPRWTQVLVLLERAADEPFLAAQQAAIQAELNAALDFTASLFDAQAGFWSKFTRRFTYLLEGRQVLHLLRRRGWLLSACVAVLASLIIPVNHRVTAKAAMEARDIQIMVAAQNGFVASSHARAGDRVLRGDLMATLETRDLKLALDKWESEMVKNRQSLQRALARAERVEIGRLRADATRIAAETALVQRQIQRSELRAPFDGLVMSGDLSQKLGSPVQQGDTLFSVAASDEHRLVLDIQEQDIALVELGQSVLVRMSALPDEVWPARVDTIMPVAVTTEDSHVFRLTAQLIAPTTALLPGMEGVAKLQAGKRSLAWVVSRGLRERGKLLLWRIGLIQ